MTNIQLTVRGLASVALLLFPAFAWGQYGGVNTNSAFGQRTLGGGTSTTGGYGTSGLGQSGLSTSGVGSSGLGSLSQGTGLGSSGMGASGQQIQQRQAGSFVGADRADTRNALSNQQQGGLQQNQSLQGQTAFFNQLSQQMRRNQTQLQQLNRNATGNQQPQLRVPLKLGFTPVPVSTRATETLARRLVRLPGLQTLGPIGVTMEGSTAVLTGRVASAGDRDLAGAMAKMEPGIEDVRNELSVGPAESTAAGSAPSR